MDVSGAAQRELDHARRHGLVGVAVDQDEGAGVAVLGVGVEGDGRGGRQIAHGDVVGRQRPCGERLERVDVEIRELRKSEAQRLRSGFAGTLNLLGWEPEADD